MVVLLSNDDELPLDILLRVTFVDVESRTKYKRKTISYFVIVLDAISSNIFESQKTFFIVLSHNIKYVTRGRGREGMDSVDYATF